MGRGRSRRAKSDSQDEQLRPRQLYDVMRSSDFYDSEGLYGGLTMKDDNYEYVASRELATQLSIDVHGAKKVLKLVGIMQNKEACSVLKKNARLGVFADVHFTKGYTSITNSGGNMCIDFLEAFVNGQDPVYHELKLQRRRKLHAIALRFTAEARDLCVTLFFKAVSVIATLCSFMPPEESFTKLSAIDIVQRYLGEGWTSDSMQKMYHRNVNLVYLVDGWHLVSEIFKVGAQEMVFLKDCDDSAKSDASSDSSRVTEEDLRENAHRFCQTVVSELFAWCYHFLAERESLCSFREDTLEILDLVQERLSSEMGCKFENIPESRITSLLKVISDNGPTMADIRYDGAAMRPARRGARLNRKNTKIVWKPRQILMRCRWDGTTAAEHYTSFLSNADAEEQKVYKQDLLSESQYVPQEADDTVIPETPEKEGKLDTVKLVASVKAVIQDIENHVAPAREQQLHTRKRPRSEDHDVGSSSTQTNRDALRMKRMKLTFEQNSRRLKQAMQTRTGGQVNKSDVTGNFLSDGDISEDEDLLTSRIVGRSKEADAGIATLNDKRPALPRIGEKKQAQETNFSIQLFYESILSWPIMPIHELGNLDLRNPRTRQEQDTVSDLLKGDMTWANLFWDNRGGSLYRDVTVAPSIDRYREHWRQLLHVEVRGNLSEEIATLLPTAKENPKVNWTVDIEKEKFLSASISEVQPCKGLFNIVCRTTNPQVNRRIAQELRGGTICVGYLEHTKPSPIRPEGFSPLLLVLCRRVHWEGGDVVPQGADICIDELQLHMALSRDRHRYCGGIWKDTDVLHFFMLSHFTPYLRMFKSVHEVSGLPRNIANILCGHRDLGDLPKTSTVDAVSEHRVDDGCANYLKRVKCSTGMLDESQLHALHSVLANVGPCDKNSSSISLIQGPPGTGKTTLINILTGAFLAHSKAGHIDREQINELKNDLPPDDILRCSKNEFGLKILICCPSNQAVDKILRRMHKEGIPDGRGGRFRPQAVRLAKAGYQFGDLSSYSIDRKALPFDKLMHHPNEIHRKTASTAARNSFAKECLLVFCTLSTSGGSRLKDLKMQFDVVVVDEAGQCLEAECLIPGATVMKNNVLGRFHTVLVGDPNQLPAVAKGTKVVDKSKMRYHIDYEKQTKSLLERLQHHKRASCVMLTRQYRMHPCISELHSPMFYRGIVKSPLPASLFETPYNHGWDYRRRCFAPVTLIDTSMIPDRYEINDGNGSVVNMTEVDIIDETLHELRRLCGDQFETLRNEIGVIVPYRSQVNQARLALARVGKYKEGEGLTQQGFQIKVDTVDSMQGSERDVIIFGSTRSNRDQTVGFVEHKNRLNVAVSRARKLFIAIVDMSTLDNTMEFGKMWDYCMSGRNGAALLVRKMGANEKGGTGCSELVVDKNHVPQYS